MIELAGTQAAQGEIPSVAQAAEWVLVGGLVFLPALWAARRLVPPAPAADARWTPGDVLLVVAVALLASVLVRMLFPGEAVLSRIVRSQLVFAAAGGACLCLARGRSAGPAALGLTPPPRARALLAGLLAYGPLLPLLLGAGAFWALLCQRLGWEVGQGSLRSIAELQGRELGLALVIATGPGPFLEELLFRGFLQGALARVRGEGPGLVACALLFALLHGRSAFLPLFLLSLFLGWLQRRTRSLFVPWAVHAVHNGLTLALTLAPAGR